MLFFLPHLSSLALSELRCLRLAQHPIKLSKYKQHVHLPLHLTTLKQSSVPGSESAFHTSVKASIRVYVRLIALLSAVFSYRTMPIFNQPTYPVLDRAPGFWKTCAPPQLSR